MKKKLYLIGGTMGVGKTTSCKLLRDRLPNCAFLDGDWCWDMHPFVVNDETKAMVIENICFLLNSYIKCSAFENIVFCWVMHEQSIIDDILSRLDTANCKVFSVSLVCSEEELKTRLQKDIDENLRIPDVLERSLSRIALYDKLSTLKLDVSSLTPEQTAEKLERL